MKYKTLSLKERNQASSNQPTEAMLNVGKMQPKNTSNW